MGRTLENKKEIVKSLKDSLSTAQMALVIDYKGLTVGEMAELRGRLRESGATCTITKNTLMRIATEEDEQWKPMSNFLTGTSAFIWLNDDLGKGIKAYQAFQKETNKTELRGGVMEGRALNAADINAITELPTKEELIARIAGGIKAIPTKLAVGTKQVPTKLAVGIQEVPNSLVRAIDAVAKKEEAA